MFISKLKVGKILFLAAFLVSQTVEQKIDEQKPSLRGRNLVGDGYLSDYALSEQPIEG